MAQLFENRTATPQQRSFVCTLASSLKADGSKYTYREISSMVFGTDSREKLVSEICLRNGISRHPRKEKMHEEPITEKERHAIAARLQSALEAPMAHATESITGLLEDLMSNSVK